jgi:hypothetical protein
MKLNLRSTFLFACLAILGAVAACSDTGPGRNANPAGPSMECGGYLGGGGGKAGDTTRVPCPTSATPPADSI